MTSEYWRALVNYASTVKYASERLILDIFVYKIRWSIAQWREQWIRSDSDHDVTHPMLHSMRIRLHFCRYICITFEQWIVAFMWYVLPEFVSSSETVGQTQIFHPDCHLLARWRQNQCSLQPHDFYWAFDWKLRDKSWKREIEWIIL